MIISKAILLIIILSGLASLSDGQEVEEDEDEGEEGTGRMVKMCLFYTSPSGHARTDPILNQECPSDHVHTFYGPQNFHPNTSNADLRMTSPEFSTTPIKENQSLYWHPSIYEVTVDDGENTYTRVNDLETSPYYRWDKSPGLDPPTEAFPKDFHMIAYSDQQGANKGGETGGNLFIECCNISNGEESCTSTTGGVVFPKKKCDFLGIAFAMPTCWNGETGPVTHMSYTADGTVAGDCPKDTTYTYKRLPQIQLFVRISNYKGDTLSYALADESNVFHVDFMNGWKEGKLQEIIDNCPVQGSAASYNPPCNCIDPDEFQFVEENETPSNAMCDSDIRNLIIDEATDVVNVLPRGTCEGDNTLIEKSWTGDPTLDCNGLPPTPSPPTSDCTDSNLRMFMKGKARNCEWVGRRNTEKRCAKKNVATHCPNTCEQCEEFDCSDSKRRFKLGDEKKGCWMVRNNLELCNEIGIEETCRQACDFCE